MVEKRRAQCGAVTRYLSVMVGAVVPNHSMQRTALRAAADAER